MATLTEILGGSNQNPTQGVDIAGNISEGLKTGVQLATVGEQVESAKAKLQQDKADLVMKQASTANSLLTNLARANPSVAKQMLKGVRERLINLGVDPGIADYTVSDDANRKRQIAFSQLASGKLNQNPEFAGEYFQGLADLVGYDQAAQMFDNEMKRKQQDKQFAIQESRVAASQAKDEKRLDTQEERIQQQYVEKLSKRLSDPATGIPEVLNAVESIEAETGGIYSPEAEAKFDEIAGKKGLIASLKIPMTQIMPLENSAIDEEDMPLYQSVAGLRNAYLKLRSGGAVTDPEASRFLQELGQGSIRSGKQLQTGIQHLNNAVKKGVKSIEAGYDPAVVQRYKDQGAAITSSAFPSPEAAIAGPTGSDPEIETKLKSLPPGADPEKARAALIKAKQAKSAKASK